MNHLILLADLIAANPSAVYRKDRKTFLRFEDWATVLHYTAKATGYEYQIQVRGEIVYHPRTITAGVLSSTFDGAVIYSAIEGEQETARAFYGASTVAGYDTQVIKTIADRFFDTHGSYVEQVWRKWAVGV